MSNQAFRSTRTKQALIERHINAEHETELLESAFLQHTISEPDMTNILIEIDRGNSYE